MMKRPSIIVVAWCVEVKAGTFENEEAHNWQKR